MTVAALPTRGELLQAAKVRLAGWTADQVAAALGDAETALAGGDVDAAFAELVGGLDGADTRSPATAAAALLVLDAERRRDAALLWRAGAVVLEGQRQARRGAQRRAEDPLDAVIAAFLRRTPGAGARRVSDYLRFLAAVRSEPIVDADDDGLAYQTRGAIRSATWPAVAIRVSRIRKKLSEPVPEIRRSQAASEAPVPGRSEAPAAALSEVH